jgi:hypothetical protein
MTFSLSLKFELQPRDKVSKLNEWELPVSAGVVNGSLTIKNY